MDNVIKQTGIMEKTGAFDETMKKRYELTMEYKGIQGKKIMVICINPASDKIQITDTTTNYLMNNLLVMGYSTITLCNLFADITGKLKLSEVVDNVDNMAYIEDVVKREFDHILIGFGNTFSGNRKVETEKEALYSLLKPNIKKLVELVDAEEVYKNLKTIHPLFAGQRFSGSWKFRKFEIPKGKDTRKKAK